MLRTLSASLTLLWVATCAWAGGTGLQGENLLQATPDGYKLATSGRNGNVLTDEMIPRSQNIDHWNEMLTTQIYMGGIGPRGPEAFYRRLSAAWERACPGAMGKLIKTGTENGYPMAVWMQACPENPDSGRPEYSWFKAIQGRDSFYLVQKAWRFAPDPQQVKRWTRYLGTIAVCDSRIADQSCAALTR